MCLVICPVCPSLCLCDPVCDHIGLSMHERGLCLVARECPTFVAWYELRWFSAMDPCWRGLIKEAMVLRSRPGWCR